MQALFCILAMAQAFCLSFAAPSVPEASFSKSVSRRDLNGTGDLTSNCTTTFLTETFAAPELKYPKNDLAAPGLLFFTPYGAPSPPNRGITNSSVIMTDDGELVWMSPFSNYYTDLRTQSYDNQTYLTFWNSSIGGPSRGNGYGSVDFLDSSLNLAHRVCLSSLDLTTPTGVKWPCQVDLHEHQMTDRNTLLVTVYNVTQTDLTSVNGSEHGWILDSQFYEVDPSTEEILFAWKMSDHLDELPVIQSHYPVNFPTYSLGFTQAYPWDPFHINSIQALVDGYIVSSRHYWTIYKILNNGTIEWQWKGDQGMNCPNDATSVCNTISVTPFAWQHHVRVDSTLSEETYLQLTMFDNGNSEVDNGTSPSVGKMYHLDTFARVAHQDAIIAPLQLQLQDPADEVYSDSQGSYQILSNGNTLLGYGQVPKIKEFDSNGTLVYEAEFGRLESTISFRTFRLNDWHAIPSYPPKVDPQMNLGNPVGLNVSMSWNGATDIDAWNINFGHMFDTTPMKLIATVPKNGFETFAGIDMDLISLGFGVVQVEALQGGKVIGTSHIVSVGVPPIRRDGHGQ